MGVSGGAFEGVEDQVSPFGYGRGEGVDAGHGDPEWICSKEKPHYDEIFRQLNPIDGKVTGAGMPLRTLLQILHTHPHLRSHIVVDKALEALLTSSRNCSLLTELCVNMKERDPEQRDEESFTKVVDLLSTATDNCQMITKFLVDTCDVASGSHMSSAVSIHSLHDTMSIDARRSESPRSRRRSDSGFFTNTDGGHSSAKPKIDYEADAGDGDIEDNESDASGANSDGPLFNIKLTKTKTKSLSYSMFETIKIIFFFSLNVVMLVMLAEFLFLSIVYMETGDRYIEFEVEEFPNTWLDWAKSATFGPQHKTVKIQSIVELFHRDNIVNILKYLTRKLSKDTV